MNLLVGLNWVDVVLLILAAVSLVVGYVQGLLRQVISLAALYIAIILGAQYYAPFAAWMRAVTFQPNLSRISNMIAFFVIVLLVYTVLTFLAQDAYERTRLKIFPVVDQFGGSILALATLVIMAVLSLAVLQFSIVEPWPGLEAAHDQIASGLGSSSLVLLLETNKEMLLNTLRPWLPAGLPSIFNL
jgi:uncharacterized membrane protein required for colicin V production